MSVTETSPAARDTIELSSFYGRLSEGDKNKFIAALDALNGLVTKNVLIPQILKKIINNSFPEVKSADATNNNTRFELNRTESSNDTNNEVRRYLLSLISGDLGEVKAKLSSAMTELNRLQNLTKDSERESNLDPLTQQVKTLLDTIGSALRNSNGANVENRAINQIVLNARLPKALGMLVLSNSSYIVNMNDESIGGKAREILAKFRNQQKEIGRILYKPGSTNSKKAFLSEVRNINDSDLSPSAEAVCGAVDKYFSSKPDSYKATVSFQTLLSANLKIYYGIKD